MAGIERYGEGIVYANSSDVVADARAIIDSSQRAAHRAINTSLVLRNWLLGRRIAEEEIRDDSREELYGRRVIRELSRELIAEYGKGFSKTSLYQYVQFYELFPEIVQTVSGQSPIHLSWSHYVELLRVKNAEARKWYEEEASNQGWSVTALSRNISSQYCERMLANHAELSHGRAIASNASAERAERLAFIKSPLVVEFLGLPSDPRIHESDLAPSSRTSSNSSWRWGRATRS